MSYLQPQKLHINFQDACRSDLLELPRCYTLTHSDNSGELFLTIGSSYNEQQISGWYTRMMRDEVLAEWVHGEDGLTLIVHCHVSGGFVVGTAGWRYKIFQQHIPLVLEAFRYGDRQLFSNIPALDQAQTQVHFHATQPEYNFTEMWGKLGNYRLK